VTTIGPPASASGARRRAALACLVILACSIGGVFLAAPVAAAALCDGSPPPGQIRVAVIVDFGTEPDSPGTTSVRCLTLADGAKGADLLRERAVLLGLPLPRYAPSGLLCALDGYPAPPECAQGSGEVRYWSYWSGTDGGWIYGTGNPFTRRLRDGDIEGWRFVRASESNAPPPRVAPDRAALFPPLSAPAPTTGPGEPGTGGTVPATGAAPFPQAVPGSGTGSSIDGPPEQGGSPGVGSAQSREPDPTSGAAASADASIEATAPIGEPAAAAGSANRGLPIGAIAGVILIALIGAGAAIRFRRGTAP
jgi:hypothetical protein